MSVYSDFRRVALDQPDAPALVTFDRSVPYSTVLDLADRVAAGLRRAGLRLGDRVAVHLGNRCELASVYYACLHAGAVLVPISYRLSGSEVGRLLIHSGARFYLGEADIHGQCAAEVEGCATIEQAWILDIATATGPVRPWSDLLADDVEAPSDVPSDALASIFYTSGTTGRPKGVVHSQSTLDASLDLTTAQGAGHADVTYPMVDLINPWAILILLTTLRQGRPLALSPAHTPDVILRMLRTHRCGWIGGAPSTLRGMIEQAHRPGAEIPDLRDTSCVVGGDACSPEVARDFFATFGSRLESGYGMTETGGPVTHQPDLDFPEGPTIGWPLPGVEVRVDAAQGEVGELLLRTPSRPAGLWNGADVDRYDRSQWIATGDLVREGADGLLLFLGRQKDLIKVDCYPVSPLEVEQVLLAHPGVAAAVVFGIPDPVVGERAIALVQPQAGVCVLADDLLQHLTGRIAAYKHPSAIQIVDRLPVMQSGKIGRQQLAASYTQSSGPPPRSPRRRPRGS